MTHHSPRRTFFVPGCLGFPRDVTNLRNERSTRINEADETFSQWTDKWRLDGPYDPGLGWWTGHTFFAFQGFRLPWDPPTSPMSSDGTGPDSSAWETASSGTESEGSRRASGSGPSRTEQPDAGRRERSRSAARDYIEAIQKVGAGTPTDWKNVIHAGNRLLRAAGSVEDAARALWRARPDYGLDNLKGVNNPILDQVLHPDLVAYLRDVEANGMAARFQGTRRRVEGSLHPMAKKHLDQVYRSRTCASTGCWWSASTTRTSAPRSAPLLRWYRR